MLPLSHLPSDIKTNQHSTNDSRNNCYVCMGMGIRIVLPEARVTFDPGPWINGSWIADFADWLQAHRRFFEENKAEIAYLNLI